jgi:DNA repair exonuclease SbcCD ATPase subunit
MELTDSLNEKISQEIEKIKEEIKELQKKWYHKESTWIQIATLLLAFTTLGVAYFSGFIDNQFKELTLDKKQLEYDIAKFQDKKDSLTLRNISLVQKLDSTKTVLNQIAPKVREASSKLEAALKDYNRIKNQNDKFKDEIAEIEYLISQGKNKEATERLQKMIKSYGALKSAFSSDFSDEFR